MYFKFLMLMLVAGCISACSTTFPVTKTIDASGNIITIKENVSAEDIEKEREPFITKILNKVDISDDSDAKVARETANYYFNTNFNIKDHKSGSLRSRFNAWFLEEFLKPELSAGIIKGQDGNSNLVKSEGGVVRPNGGGNDFKITDSSFSFKGFTVVHSNYCKTFFTESTCYLGKTNFLASISGSTDGDSVSAKVTDLSYLNYCVWNSAYVGWENVDYENTKFKCNEYDRFTVNEDMFKKSLDKLKIFKIYESDISTVTDAINRKFEKRIRVESAKQTKVERIFPIGYETATSRLDRNDEFKDPNPRAKITSRNKTKEHDKTKRYSYNLKNPNIKLPHSNRAHASTIDLEIALYPDQGKTSVVITGNYRKATDTFTSSVLIDEDVAKQKINIFLDEMATIFK